MGQWNAHGREFRVGQATASTTPAVRTAERRAFFVQGFKPLQVRTSESVGNRPLFSVGDPITTRPASMISVMISKVVPFAGVHGNGVHSGVIQARGHGFSHFFRAVPHGVVDHHRFFEGFWSPTDVFVDDDAGSLRQMMP